MKIVIVEDEKSIRTGLCGMLPKLNPDYKVVGEASNGVDGLEVIARTRPDLVIMDIQMPQMDGLTMLEELRKRGVLCRVIVLSAYSDFSYAKRAIELNIENYLLKPIKIPELKQQLEHIAQTLEQEKTGVKLQERLLSLEQIFRGSILAELPVDAELNQMTMEKYGLNVEEPLALFSVCLEDHYEEQVGPVEHILEEYTGRAADYRRIVIRFSRHQMVVVIIYNISDMEKIKKRYESLAYTLISKVTGEDRAFNWAESRGLAGIADAFEELWRDRMWNLSFPQGTVVSRQLIQNAELTELKYPLDMEEQIRRVMQEGDLTSIQQVLRLFRDRCVESVHHPDEIREVCIRFCLTFMKLARALGKITEAIPAQSVIGRISQSVSWEEIWAAIEEMYQVVTVEQPEAESMSLLVRQAKQIIEEYYTQGITLEELAQKLCVSEEYLSTQFKKETGVSFKDTVRKYRIDRVKELLLHSSLKLNQIADMVGYTDPKYMSKVFKDEVGILPAEFRKMSR